MNFFLETYSIVPIVNNTVQCTWRFVQRVDLMLGVLTTIKKQANKSILLENSNAPTLQDQMSEVKVHLPPNKSSGTLDFLSSLPLKLQKKSFFLPKLRDKEEMTCNRQVHLRASQWAAKSLKGSEIGWNRLSVMFLQEGTCWHCSWFFYQTPVAPPSVCDLIPPFLSRILATPLVSFISY